MKYKYQYDDMYFIMCENGFLDFLDNEEEDAFARVLTYGRRN